MKGEKEEAMCGSCGNVYDAAGHQPGDPVDLCGFCWWRKAARRA